jgi:hypothetical protein
MSGSVPAWLHNIKEEDVERLLASDKGVIREFARWVGEPSKVDALQVEVTRLSQEILRLRTVQLRAYDEIKDFWSAHCDADGLGPRNLLRHLHEGTGYYPGYLALAAGKMGAEDEK